MKTWMATATLAAIVCAPQLAWAGDVKFGAEPLATDDSGKLTDAGRQAAVTDLPSEPGEELWILHVWAQIDKGAPGPLYADFIGKLPDGKSYTAFRHEHAEYDGEKFVSYPIELDGNSGLNKGKTYTVNLKQISNKGKDILLASSKVTLVYTDAPAEPESSDEGGDTDGASEDVSAQDEFDTLGAGGGDDGPPPVESKGKKGCAVDAHAYGSPGWLMLLMLGAVARRRRNRTP